MKKFFQCSLSSFSWLLLSLTASHGLTAVGPANFVANGSFEDEGRGEIIHWENSLDASNRDEGKARSGEASLRLRGPSQGYSNVNPAPSLKPGTDYVLRYWVDASQVAGANNSYVRLRLVDLDNSRIHSFGHENAWSYPRRTRDWILIEQKFTTGEDFGNSRLDLMWDIKEGDVAWVDDITLAEVGEHEEAEELLILTKMEQAASDGRGIFLAEIRLTDVHGNPVMDEDIEVEVSIRGGATLINGNEHRLRNGRAFVHLKGGGKAGDIAELNASAGRFSAEPVEIEMIVPSRAKTPEAFLYGYFEDGNLVWQSSAFRDMMMTVRESSENINFMMLTNGGTDRTTALFEVAEDLEFDLFMYPPRDIFYDWFDDEEIEHSLEKAIEVARPVVEEWKDFSRNAGYYTIDEPTWDKIYTTATITEAFQILDPTKPTAAVLANGHRVPHMFDVNGADILLINPYPVRGNTTVGSWTEEFVEEIRAQSRTLPAGYPLWTILQTHGSENPGWSGAAVRTPEPEEVRAQFWLAIGEGTQCLTWFIYKTQQFWIGVEDNPGVKAETIALAERLSAFREIIPQLTKIEDRFEVTSTGDRPYVSTLFSPDFGNYVVINNGDCEREQELTVTAEAIQNRGVLEDLESGQRYALGRPIRLAPGDGAILRYRAR